MGQGANGSYRMRWQLRYQSIDYQKWLKFHQLHLFKKNVVKFRAYFFFALCDLSALP